MDMEKIEKRIKGLAKKLEGISRAKRNLVREIINACLEIIDLAEKKKISFEKADHLFGYLLHEDVLPDEIHEIVLDGASLELTPQELEGRQEVDIQKIKKRLLELQKSFL